MTPAGGGSREPVAIVGIACRFPGGVTGPDSFWELLTAGRNAITEIPADRIDLAHWYDPRPATPGRIMTRWGGFLDRIEDFDAAFFGLSPREAERLDPQQRLALETAWEAFEDAGQDVNALAGSRTGVFIGQWLSDFEARLFADPERADFFMTTGSGRYATSGRISYLLGLEGPSLTLDTACSSSLVAVHLAAQSLRAGECTLALAGGVNVILQPHISVAYSQSRMMAPDGRCKFGDASGDGYVRSEGAGLVLLKPLDRALADGDRIYAVIRGSAVNNDGRGSGSMGTPSRGGQEALLRTAYADAGVAPGEVGYVEAHGTGTRAGDPVELGALGAVLGADRAPGSRLRVGSVKTNIGHTEGAAGVAGLIKLALCLHHRAVPASLHCRELNPAISWNEVPLEIAREQGAWTDEAAVGGVSAFGIAGTNAHVVLQRVAAGSVAPATTSSPAQGARPREFALLPLSARDAQALRELASRYAALLAEPHAPALNDLCAAAAHRRTALEHRAVLLAEDAPGLRQALEAYAAGEPPAAAGVAPAAAPRVAFVVPGQGAQWTGMARELMVKEPVFADALRRCDAAARRYVDWSLVEQLSMEPGAAGYLLDRIDVIQPVLVALAIAYAEWLASVGVRAEAFVGHSMGEVGAAYLAGALDLDSAMRIICRRSALMRETSGRGAMALVDLSMTDAAARIGPARADRVSVAVSNSPRSSVISGEPAAVDEILAECERDGVFCRRVKVDVASHSPQMDGPSASLRAELRDLSPADGAVALYSTVLARRTSGAAFDADYWASNLRQPVRFADTVAQMLADGITVFVELGPHPVLLPAIQQTAQAQGVAEVVTIACARRDEPEQCALLTALGALWASGVRVDWQAVQPRSASVTLPSYPWQRERLWVREARQRRRGAGHATAAELDPAMLGWLHRQAWVPLEGASSADPAKPEEWWIVSSAQPLAVGLQRALEVEGRRVRHLAPAEVDAALRELPSRGAATGIVLLAARGEDAPWSLVALARAGAAAAPRARLELWAVTSGAQSIAGHERPGLDVAQAALWGAGRVIAEELPDLWGGLIDADPALDAEASADAIARELLAGGGAGQRALRGGQRFTLQLRAVEAAEIEPAGPAWRADGAYLVTGGLGAIGLHIASAMVAQGARRLVLLGRSGLPPRTEWSAVAAESPVGRRIAGVRALEAAGAAVHLLAADAADPAALEAALEGYAAEAWPPIVGVIHAAGITSNRLVEQLDRAAFDAVMDAKLSSALHLDRLLPQVEKFILFSSIGASVGWPGIANYAAANAGLDGLAQARLARGAPAQCLQWGPWAGTGMHSGEEVERYFEELRRQGIGEFTPAQGEQLFSALTATRLPDVTILPVDWSVMKAKLRGRHRELFATRLQATAGESAAGGDFAARLAACDTPEQRRVLLEALVREAVANAFGIGPQQLDARRALGAMGLTSLLAMEIRNRLEARLGRALPASLTWNYPTVEQIVRYLAGDAAVPPAAPTAAATVTPQAMDGELQQIAGLSDEDAMRELMGLGATP